MNSDELNKKRPNKPWSIDERSFQKKSWFIVILICLIAIIIHGLFILVLYLGWNRNLLFKSSPSVKKPELVYELAYNEPKIDRFVETNPNLVPEDPPEKTNNFAAQSQRAAQENPDITSHSERPRLDGDREEYIGIMENLPALETTPDVPYDDPVVAQVADTSPIVQSMNDFLSMNSSEGTDSKKIEVLDLVRPKPKPRPSLAQSTIGAIMKNDHSASVLGSVGVSAKFSQFGAYLQKMFEKIGYQFQLLFSNYSGTAADFNSYVAFSYSIDENGNVTHIEVVSGTASKLATILCKDAILSQAPFGPWTDEMKVALGKEQTIKVGFILQ